MAFYFSVQPYFFSYLQVVHGHSIKTAGHITQVFSFAATVTSIVVSFLIKFTARYKYFVFAGSCVYVMALGLMIRYRSENSSIGQLVGTQLALGIGGGMLNVPAQLGVQASAHHQELAAATAMFLTVLSIGGAVGSAVSGAVWSDRIPSKLQSYLPAESQGLAMSIYANLSMAQSFPRGSPERVAVNRAYQETMHTLLIIAICVALPLLPLALIMANYKLDKVSVPLSLSVLFSLYLSHVVRCISINC